MDPGFYHQGAPGRTSTSLPTKVILRFAAVNPTPTRFHDFHSCAARLINDVPAPQSKRDFSGFNQPQIKGDAAR